LGKTVYIYIYNMKTNIWLWI